MSDEDVPVRVRLRAPLKNKPPKRKLGRFFCFLQKISNGNECERIYIHVLPNQIQNEKALLPNDSRENLQMIKNNLRLTFFWRSAVVRLGRFES